MTSLLKNDILDFYKRTSPYTDLGLYNDFARNLPDDIDDLCLLQRNQIIHANIDCAVGNKSFS